MIHYLWWVPCTIVIALVYSWISVLVNRNPGSWLFWILFLQIPVWPFVTRTSKNLAFDGLVYDALVCAFWALGLIWFSGAPGFKPINYCGAAAIVLGIILMKV